MMNALSRTQGDSRSFVLAWLGLHTSKCLKHPKGTIVSAYNGSMGTKDNMRYWVNGGTSQELLEEGPLPSIADFPVDFETIDSAHSQDCQQV